MAERADQERRAAAALGIWRAADVPAEPAVRAVAREAGQHAARAPGAQLDAPGARGRAVAVPGRADGDVFRPVAIHVAGADDHAAELFAGLGSLPVAQLFSGGPGVDEYVARSRVGLV